MSCPFGTMDWYCCLPLDHEGPHESQREAASPASAPTDQVAWLVEEVQHGEVPCQWWTGELTKLECGCISCIPSAWTTDSTKARKFATQDDAERAIREYFVAVQVRPIATEHMWVGPVAPPSSPPETTFRCVSCKMDFGTNAVAASAHAMYADGSHHVQGTTLAELHVGKASSSEIPTMENRFANWATDLLVKKLRYFAANVLPNENRDVLHAAADRLDALYSGEAYSPRCAMCRQPMATVYSCETAGCGANGTLVDAPPSSSESVPTWVELAKFLGVDGFAHEGSDTLVPVEGIRRVRELLASRLSLESRLTEANAELSKSTKFYIDSRNQFHASQDALRATESRLAALRKEIEEMPGFFATCADTPDALVHVRPHTPFMQQHPDAEWVRRSTVLAAFDRSSSPSQEKA